MYLAALRMAFATVVTTCVFSLVALFGLLIFGIMTLPAKAAEKCTITASQFSTFLTEIDEFDEPQAMPQKFLKGFVKLVSERYPALAKADGVVIRQSKGSPSVMVIFIKGKCLVNWFQMPIPLFTAMLQKSQGDAI